MILRPPTSTLFPTRRSSDLHGLPGLHTERLRSGPHNRRHDQREHERSEEHTSELQSRFDLVCRLLLEKKKKKQTKNMKNNRISEVYRGTGNRTLGATDRREN